MGIPRGEPSLKERIEELKATRDQARIDAEHSKAAVENAGQIITATQLGKFAQAARRRIGGCDDDYRGIICARLRSESRSPSAKSASWARTMSF